MLTEEQWNQVQAVIRGQFLSQGIGTSLTAAAEFVDVHRKVIESTVARSRSAIDDDPPWLRQVASIYDAAYEEVTDRLEDKALILAMQDGNVKALFRLLEVRDERYRLRIHTQAAPLDPEEVRVKLEAFLRTPQLS